jgi:hypothetical protein
MRFVTWTDYNFPKRDLPVTKAVAACLNGKHVFLRGGKPRHEEELVRVSQAAALNTGHFRGNSLLAANMRRKFPEKNSVFVRGYGGEILRGFYNSHRRPIEAVTVSELVRAYNSSLKGAPSTRYLNLVSEAVEQFMLRAGYEGLDQTGFDINDIYYWEQRMGMWGSAMQNQMDSAMLSMVGFNSRALYESAFGLRPQERFTKDLQMDLTRRYDPQLSTIPVI